MNQSELRAKQIDVDDAKRGKTRVNKSRFILDLLLID